MHIVYFHPDKKNGYGATTISRWHKRLKEQNLDVTKGRIVEQGLTLKEASDRERELQLRDGYPLDVCSYKHIRAVQPLAAKATKTPEAKAKAAKNKDCVKMGKSISRAKKGKPVPHLFTKEAIKKKIATKRLTVYPWYKELTSGFIGTCSDMRNRYNIVNLSYAVKKNRPLKTGPLKGLHFIKYA